MRIGFSGCALGGGRTGIATYVLHLINALQKVDTQNEYDLLTLPNEASFFSLNNPHFHLKSYPSIFAPPIANIAWHNFALPWIAQKRDYALVHIPTVRRIPLIKGTKLVATVHDLAPFVLPHKYDPLRLFYHKQILPWMLHRCDHVIAVSENTKKDILRFTTFPEDKISVIYPGIALEAFSPFKKEEAKNHLHSKYGIDRPFLVYVSRIEHPGKNHLSLIRAFEQFQRLERSPFLLVFAGADWNGAETVKRYVKDHGLEHSVRFLGFVPQQDIVQLYSRCELMVFPSLYEGFGFPLLEAMACKAPVIAANCSSLRELGEGRIALFDPTNPREISDAIQQALQPSYRKQTLEPCYLYARQFEWTRTARAVISIYNQVARA